MEPQTGQWQNWEICLRRFASWDAQAGEPSQGRLCYLDNRCCVGEDTDAVTSQARRITSFPVATNVLDSAQVSDHELVQTYSEQHSVERGCAFLKDPLFLASSVFVKKSERIAAPSLVMMACLLVYRLAEHRLHAQLAATSQTVPSQLKQPTDRPTMRWMFPCFEGISLVRFVSPPPHGPPLQEIAGVEPLHTQVLRLLGPSYEQLYELSA